MANNKNQYPKQPHNPNRKPGESVTWVRNLEKVSKRTVIVGKYPIKTVPSKNPSKPTK